MRDFEIVQRILYICADRQIACNNSGEYNIRKDDDLRVNQIVHVCVGIQGEDSGTFGCTKVSSDKNSNDEALIRVQVLGNEISQIF